MTIAQSKITAEGQILVPVEIRRKLGVGPGSALEWDQEGGQIVVRRGDKDMTQDLYRALFPEETWKRSTLQELKARIAQYFQERYGRA